MDSPRTLHPQATNVIHHSGGTALSEPEEASFSFLARGRHLSLAMLSRNTSRCRLWQRLLSQRMASACCSTTAPAPLRIRLIISGSDRYLYKGDAERIYGNKSPAPLHSALLTALFSDLVLLHIYPVRALLSSPRGVYERGFTAAPVGSGGGRIQRCLQVKLSVWLRLMVVAPDLVPICHCEGADGGQLDACDDLELAELVELGRHIRPESHHGHHALPCRRLTSDVIPCLPFNHYQENDQEFSRRQIGVAVQVQQQR